jgi:serine/threonine protein phosphatase 1
LFRRLFNFSTRVKGASGPQGSRAYAIGDIHGCRAQLEALLALIERDNAARGPAKTYLVVLGDLVDRGPDSRGVIDLFVNRPPAFARPIFLQGNHEEFFLNVLNDGDDVVADWLTYGGYECAESYGVSKGWTMNATPHEIVERIRAAVPAAHKQFLENMSDSFRFGDYFFAHAGIRPGIDLAEQSSRDLRWIRDGFLDDRTDHGVVVIHGHTIVEAPEEKSNRIGVDTGAYRSGILTAIGLEGSERWFLQTGGEGGGAP